jgi:hypothetical protein
MRRGCDRHNRLSRVSVVSQAALRLRWHLLGAFSCLWPIFGTLSGGTSQPWHLVMLSRPYLLERLLSLVCFINLIELTVAGGRDGRNSHEPHT